MAKDGAHILVSGAVQGVGYRAWTEQIARELGVAGWVRNLHDGRVEILAVAERAVLDEFLARCRRGPRSAEVSGLAVTPATPSRAHAGGSVSPTAFSVRRTADAPFDPRSGDEDAGGR